MNESDLNQLSHAELVQLVLKQSEQLTALAAGMAALKVEVDALRLKLEKGQKPPTNSSNSSQPPSRDQKSNRAAERGQPRQGPPAGHEKSERKFVAQADRVVILKPERCPKCQTDLQTEAGRLVQVNQITELPAPRAEVIEVRQYAVVCPGCGQEHRAEPPVGLEWQRRFGARLETTVVYYRQTQHLSYVRTVQALHDLHQVELSQGGIDQIMQRAGQRALPQIAALQAAIQQSEVVYSDETACRVDCNNWPAPVGVGRCEQWVFSSAQAVLHVIRFDRSIDVIKEVLAKHSVRVWVSDCYLPQMQAPAQLHQICMAHQLRNLQAVVDRVPAMFWPRAMQALFRAGIHLHHRRTELSGPTFERERQRLERLCTWLLARGLLDRDAQRLQRRYRKYRQSLFVFLHYSAVSPTNNVSERYLRPSVIHRKVMGSFRSEWGAHAYAALASLIATAALTGSNSFDAIQNLLGAPALPLAGTR